MLVDICLPVYNDGKILEENALRVYEFCRQQDFPFEWRIVIIVNGSTDNSATVAQDMASRYDQIHTLVLPNPGRGQALREAWKKSNADIVSYMDADLAVDLSFLDPLITPIINNETDISIGCRLHSNSEVTRSLGREIISRSFNVIAQKILSQPYLDLQCGFKAIRRSAFNDIYPRLRENYWFFDTELVIFSHQLHYRVKEVPVNWQDERFKDRTSKVRLLKDSISFLKNLWKLRTTLKQENKNKEV